MALQLATNDLPTIIVVIPTSLSPTQLRGAIRSRGYHIVQPISLGFKQPLKMEGQVLTLQPHLCQLFLIVRKLRLASITNYPPSYSHICILVILYVTIAPSVPRFVVATLISPLVVQVSWFTPSSTRGVITQYRVYATPVAIPLQRRKRQISEDVIEKVR